MLVTLVPLYQSECSPPSHRGLMVGYHVCKFSLQLPPPSLTVRIQGILIASSYTLAGLVSFGCFYAPFGNFQWRFREWVLCD
jgi:hypothetical protein